MLAEPTDFTGGVAVITGAGSGIGAGLVTYAASLGMRIALADISSEAIEKRAAELAAEGVETLTMQVDVSKPDQVEALAERVFDTWGEVSLLVNNAGVELHGNTWELPVDKWQRIINVNLNGVFYGMRFFIPRMLKQEARGHVVNVSSVAALRINAGTASYAATKHGNLALTECAAAEMKAVSDNVVFSAVLPGAVRTRIFEDAMTADDDGFAAKSKADMTEALATLGIDPVEAAEIIFTGAARGDLRIHTDPAMSRELIAERSASLAF
ncbi:MAG: oxidoreductase, short chain dehydrogenase/reductase family protein [Nocardioidaceae bacterium]|nr:oxidoreductase, short chain dehydrogenase/reductase family protein [Nocardioidaceae bacterium]